MPILNKTQIEGMAEYLLECFAVAGYTEIHSDHIAAVIKDYVSSDEACDADWIARHG